MRRNVFTTYDPNLPMGKKFVAVHVQNEDPLYFLVEVKAKVCELFVQISKFLNLLEPELFGLAIRSSAETFMFLDPFEKLSKYAPKSWKTQNNGMDNEGLPLFNVYFRVQFYVDSYLFISCKVAKYYYYHQLRENVLRYEQSMSEERAFLLASYALQADYGNYNAKLHKNRYFDPTHYFPSWVIEELGYDYILRYLPSLHCDHKGMSKSEAQSMFIREASDPMAAHNFHLYRMIANKKLNSSTNSTAPASAPSTDTWLAITITGLMIYAAEPVPTSLNSFRRLKTRISFFAWSDIGKLSFDKKKFEIRSIGPQSRKFTYYTGLEELARFLLWFSRASHQFHLMVLPKMREMLKREAEINRRKYRESCISTTNNRILSTSNGSNSSDSGCASNNNNNTNVPISNTSKSISPFEFGSSASSNSSTESAIKHKKCITSDLDISTTSSSVCFGIMDCNDSIKDSVDGILVEDQQRISVISNASSNTTSGIASDKIHSGLGEEDSDPESDLLMSLNGHHHHHRAITLSGCSPQPVVSMESLAMSEPINDNHRNNNHHHQNNFAAKSAMMRNKKHSISISNIMITTNADQALSPIPSPSSSNSQVKTAKTIPSAAAAQKTATTEIIVNAENTSKVSLCLEINDSKLSNNSPNADYSDLNDEIDSLSFNDNNNNRYSSSNNKSNVTVLSTILKPEAERLLKQGIEADDVIDAFNNSAANVNTIDSIELAELKQFEKQEKEKIILNSLIDNIPPPPALNSSLDSSDSDSDSDLSDDDDENNDDDYTQWRHYSPIAQEKRIHDKKQQQLHIDSTSLNQDEVQHVTAGRLRSKSSNANDRKCNDNSSMNTHIYENVPFNASINANDHNAYSRVVQALITTPHKNLNKFAAENVLSLRPYPSLNSVPTGTSNYPYRTGMRIGISSLSRPSSAQKNVAHLLLQGGCVHATNHYQQNSNHNIPSSLLNGQALCSLNSANISAGSEPNLYFDRMNQFQQMCTKNNTDNSAIRNVQHSQLSTVVAKQPIINKNHFDNHTVESSMSKQPLILNFSKPNETMSANFDSNIYITPPPSADYHKKTLDQVSPFKNSTSSQTPHNTTNQHLKSNVLKEHSASTSVPKKSKELRLKELRQRTSDLNLPLITALFNDSSLQLSNRFLDHPPSKSRSMQHLTSSSAITNTSSHNQHKHHHSNGNCSSGGCTSASSSSSTSSTPSRASPSSVERSCTFRVDEVIAKSAIRRNDVHNDSGKNRDENYSDDEQRPISWHIDKSNPYVNATTVPAQNGWHNQFYVDGSSTNHNNIQSKHNQSHHQSQQPRRSSTGNSIINGGLTPKMIIQPTMTHQFYKLRS